MLKVQIRNLQKKIRFRNKYLEGIIKKSVSVLAHGRAAVEVNLIIVDNTYIRRINRKYRHMDRVTDVIAFPSGKCPGWPGASPEGGDIVISAERAFSQASEFGHSLKKEMTVLTLHGVLHLFGFDHIKKNDEAVMKKKERKILKCLMLS